jgi:adenine-specific DNA-methyltransferase
VIRNNPSGRSTVKGFAVNHEYGLFYSRSSADARVGRFPHSDDQIERYEKVDEVGGRFEWVNLRKSSSGSFRSDRPKQYFPLYYQDTTGLLRIPKMSWKDDTRAWDTLEEPIDGEIVILPLDESGRERVWNFGVARTYDELQHLLVRRNKEKYEVYARKYINAQGYLARTWWDNPAYSARDNGTRALVDLFGPTSKNFEFPKALKAVEDSLIVSGVVSDSLTMDFFAGSGTAAHAVINLNREDDGRRKYILVEMGEHFNTVILPRVKKVVFSDKWKNGQAQPGRGISHFAKYYQLEQYEDTLRRAHYEDAPLLAATDAYGPYAFLRDLRLAKDSLTLDLDANTVSINLASLYDNIDLAETLSCVTGKGIRRITRELVEFQDGTTASLTNPDWKQLRPVLWW